MKIIIKESQIKIFEESAYGDDIQRKKNELSKLKFDNKEILNQIEKLEKEIEFLEKITSPKIYTGVVKHHTTKEPYIIARSLFKKGVNDYVQLSVYVGKLKDFNNDKDSPEVMKVAKKKIQDKISKII